MPTSVDELILNNRRWADRAVRENPRFFQQLLGLQAPRFLWIGCADSRVPANEIVGMRPGELFVHRNVANLVVHTDLNCLSSVQYAVDVLKVEHVMVVGHYGCGGIAAAYRATPLGLIDNWLRHIQDIRDRHRSLIDASADDQAKMDRLCELNVVEQAMNVCRTTILQDAWAKGQSIAVHAWIYRLNDGLLHDLGFSAHSVQSMASDYAKAIEELSVMDATFSFEAP
jgi:carbonic anhydrase